MCTVCIVLVGLFIKLYFNQQTIKEYAKTIKENAKELQSINSLNCSNYSNDSIATPSHGPIANDHDDDMSETLQPSKMKIITIPPQNPTTISMPIAPIRSLSQPPNNNFNVYSLAYQNMMNQLRSISSQSAAAYQNNYRMNPTIPAFNYNYSNSNASNPSLNVPAVYRYSNVANPTNVHVSASYSGSNAMMRHPRLDRLHSDAPPPPKQKSVTFKMDTLNVPTSDNEDSRSFSSYHSDHSTSNKTASVQL